MPRSALQPLLQDLPEALEQRYTGDVALPNWAYSKHMIAWVRLLIKRDIKEAGFVKKYTGFEETAYRYVFPHMEKYSDKKEKLQNLINIQPSGARENDERLKHDDEAGLIAFTKLQTMEPDIAKLQNDVDPFVWQREDGSHAVVQTWPVEINNAFRESFETIEIPDPTYFHPDALKEFRRAMQKLFQLDDTENLTVWSVKRKKTNDYPLYVGTGKELMAMLRISKQIRDDLVITSLVEPDKIEYEWSTPDPTKEGQVNTGQGFWTLDLTSHCCLYLKKGWDKMACVKLKHQFDWDCIPIEPATPPLDAYNTKDTLPFVMDLDWFAPEAFKWTLGSVGLVWSCAIVTILLRWYGTAFGWDWVDKPVVLMGATVVACAFATYADFSAMTWCIVPWLQKVKKLAIMGCTLRFHSFLIIQLVGTCVQVFTIQNNAWVMVTAFQENNALMDLWPYLWEHSTFGIIFPDSAFKKWLTPKSGAFFFWFLSTAQLTLPLMMSVPWPGSQKRASFPSRSAGRAFVTETAELCTNHRPCSEPDFVPETFYNEFSTLWTKLVEWVLEVWGFPIIKCTYRESVANLALASGLRYTGSMSLSYPKQRIDEIIKFKQGYTVKRASGKLEPLPNGWELRALKEFQKLARCQRNRVVFITFLKLALQMNLQITFIIIRRIHQKGLDVPSKNNAIGIISVASLLLTFGVEFLDIIWMTRIWINVRSAVKATVLKLGTSSKVYAADEFVVDDEGDASIQTILHHGKDLKVEYYLALRFLTSILVITLFSAFLVSYALLKAACSVICPDGAWQYSSGCLDPSLQNETASSCFESFLSHF